jgi:SSS family solute:Na+ symporter
VPSFYGGTLGVGEYAYRYGISNWVTQGLPYYFFSLLYAWLAAGRIRSRPGMTISDHIGEAYGKWPAVLAALLVFVLASPADEALMLGTLAQWATGLPLWACLAAVLSACLGLLFAGGLRSDVRSNQIEFLMMFGGFSLVLPFAYLARGGFASLASSLPPGHLDWTGGQPPLRLLTWFFIALWTFVDPVFHQRVCAAKDERTARLGILACVGFWFLYDCMTTAAGLFARSLLPGLGAPLQAFPALAGLLLPPVAKGLFLAGTASSTMAALSSTGFVAAVSIGKDAAGRVLGSRAPSEESLVRLGLAGTGLLALGLALALPSVVGLWYAVGSTVIPGLLVPLLSSYFPSARIPPAAALASSAAGCSASAAAWALGSEFPFYPGMAASIAVWAAGKAWMRLKS